MRKEREELRRGIRSFIEDASVELAEFTNAAPKTAPPPPAREAEPPRPEPPPPARPPARSTSAVREIPARRDPGPVDRPVLRLVRDLPLAEPSPFGDVALHLPKKGVCAAYFINKRCWELADAFCNHALHVCRLRECPIYALHREEMERRFAAKFKHLW